MKVFTSSYPKAPSPRVSCYQTLIDSNSRFSLSAPALIDPSTGETITRGDFAAKCLSLAAGLRNLGNIGGLAVEKGSTITVCSKNSLLYPVAMAALPAAGIRAVFANTTYNAAEIAQVISLSGSSHVLVHPETFQTTLDALSSIGIEREEARKRTVILARQNEIPQELIEEGWFSVDTLQTGTTDSLPEKFDGPAADETALIFLSSGTTGRSKAVQLSHHNVSSMMYQLDISLPFWYHDKDVVAAVLPLFHVYGGVSNFYLAYFRGIPLVVFPIFEPKLLLSSITRYKISILYAIPPLIKFIAMHSMVDHFDLSSLRAVLVGGAHGSKELLDKAEERLDKGGAGIAFLQGYGTTETCGVACYTPIEQSKSKRGTTGVLLSNMEARLVDDDGSDVAVDVPGELWLRGPSIMKGYLNDAQATDSCLSPDGWLQTGDFMKRDDEGFFTFVDRKKDIIKREGFQVSPTELEELVMKYPGVTDVAVTAVYHDELDEEWPRAYVVPADASLLNGVNQANFTEGIKEHVLTHASAAKALRGGVILVPEIPRSAAGKILRRVLSESSSKV